MRILNDNLENLVTGIGATTASVLAEFKGIFDPDLPIVPIPFFGSLQTAQVITVGLNPSGGEMRGRNWAGVDTATACARLTSYFSSADFPPHPWFARWERAPNETPYHGEDRHHPTVSSRQTRRIQHFIEPSIET